MSVIRKLGLLAGIALVLLLVGTWVGVQAGLAAVITSTAPVSDPSQGTNKVSSELAAVSTWFTADPAGSAASACTWPPPFSFSGFSVAPTYRWPVRLGAGSTLETEFVIADSKNVRFRVEDPHGRAIYDPGLVNASHIFTVTVGEAGTYRMIFEKDCFFCSRTVLSRYRIY